MAVLNIALNVASTSHQNIVTGITPEQFTAFIRQHEDCSETQKKLIARLETDLELNQRQIRTALNILGEANVPAEHQAAKLAEIAERFKFLSSTASAEPGDNANVAALKLDVQKAIDAGELATADALLADVEIEQSCALDRFAVNVADTSARRGEIALTRLRYSEAAEHFANAAAVFAPGASTRISGSATSEEGPVLSTSREMNSAIAALCFLLSSSTNGWSH